MTEDRTFQEQVEFEAANTPTGLHAGSGMTADDIYAEFEASTGEMVRPVHTSSRAVTPRVARITDDEVVELRALFAQAEVAGLGSADVLEARLLGRAGLSDIRIMSGARFEKVAARLRRDIAGGAR